MSRCFPSRTVNCIRTFQDFHIACRYAVIIHALVIVNILSPPRPTRALDWLDQLSSCPFGVYYILLLVVPKQLETRRKMSEAV
jgi:uncharacterized protein YhhL (DUF1145 family)